MEIVKNPRKPALPKAREEKKMNRLMLLVIFLGSLLLLASLASAEEKNPTIPFTPKISRVEKLTVKWEIRLRGLTTTLGERLNIEWSKKSGFQLFDWKSATVSVRSGKLVYLLPSKPNREIFLDYHGSRNEVVMGFSHEF